MRVYEDRLGEIRGREVSAASLHRANPLVVEGIDELLRSLDVARGVRIAARRAAVSLAAALGLDLRSSRRVRLPVAARTAIHVADLPDTRVLRELHDLICDQPLLAMVCDALAGHRPTGARRPPEERAAVVRALCAVVQMAVAQEEVERLEELVSSDGQVRPGAK